MLGTLTLTLSQFDAIASQIDHFRGNLKDLSITKNDYSISVCSGETLVAYVPLKTKLALAGELTSIQ